jgi:hypothetical protein
VKKIKNIKSSRGSATSTGEPPKNEKTVEVKKKKQLSRGLATSQG